MALIRGFFNFLKKIVITGVVIVAVLYAGFLYIKGSSEEIISEVKDAVQETASEAEKSFQEEKAKFKAAEEKKAEEAKLKAIEDQKKAEEEAKLKAIEDQKKAEEEVKLKAIEDKKKVEENAIALKIANDKFYFIVHEEVAKYKETSCKETIEKMKKSELKSASFEVWYRQGGSWWYTIFPAANCMENEVLKNTSICNTKRKQKSKKKDSASMKNGVIKIISNTSDGDCEVIDELKLNGHSSTFKTIWGGAKCGQFIIDAYSDKKDKPAKLCEEEFDLEQHSYKNSQTKVNSFRNPKMTKNEIINLLDTQKWAWMDGILCSDERFQVFSTKKGNYQSLKGRVTGPGKLLGLTIDENTQTFILEQHTFAPALLPPGVPSAKQKIFGKINANGTLFVKREMDEIDFNSVGSGKLKYKFVTKEGTFEPCEN